ncbi:hypothetical protein DO97_16590 [Neosynechococcus sphagnicola sy1]|uniref:Uncharacterized protein n=1 Tax=Neosynechococcus sphagnicola sy1 TaxID=1497020 RepID=A0A098TMY0_9CYAN|nr:hypothetical protein [Neosynechococcus sphagnicola]KGF73601.1 hypothetical protein DO97_16590 [Neosynechococcus sphagnicola sy1]
MNLEEKAREQLTQTRQQDEHLQENLVERATEEFSQAIGSVEEEARERLAKTRQEADHHQANLVERAAEEVGLGTSNTDN